MCTGAKPRHMARRIKLFGFLYYLLAHPVCAIGRHHHERDSEV